MSFLYVSQLTISFRADELYIETTKDRSAAQNLLEEIEMATLYHPIPRQSTGFMSRADALVKRLALRGNPILDANLFPCPQHPLFSEQESANKTLVHRFTLDLASLDELVSKAASLAKTYRAGYESVKEVDTLCQNIDDMLLAYSSIVDRLANGIATAESDGSPPDLSTELCLEPTAHVAFLTLLPTVLQEAQNAHVAGARLMSTYQLALLDLDRPGVDLSYKQNASTRLNTLVSARDRANQAVEEITGRVDRLKVARRIQSSMHGIQTDLENIRSEVAEVLIRDRYTHVTTEPLATQSPVAIPPVTSADIPIRLHEVREALSHDVSTPLVLLSSSLEKPLNAYLIRTSDDLMEQLESIGKLVPLLSAIRSQSVAMATIQEEVHELQLNIEDLKIRYDVVIEEALTGDVSTKTLQEEQSHFQADTESLRTAVSMFTNGITRRVRFLSCDAHSHTFSRVFPRKRSLSIDARVNSEFPFSLVNVDDAVRWDCNLLTIRLAGEIESLGYKADSLTLLCIAKDTDVSITSAAEDLCRVNQELESLVSLLSSTVQREEKLGQLQSLSQVVERHASGHRSRLLRSLSLVKESIRQMETFPSPYVVRNQHESLLTTRRRAADDLEMKINTWGDHASSLLGEVSEVLLMETRRLEALRDQHEIEAKQKSQEEARERLEVEARISEERRLEEDRLLRGQLALEEALRSAEEQLACEKMKREVERHAHEKADKDALKQQQLVPEKADKGVGEQFDAEEADKHIRQLNGTPQKANAQETPNRVQKSEPSSCSQPCFETRKRNGTVFPTPMSPSRDRGWHPFSLFHAVD